MAIDIAKPQPIRLGDRYLYTLTSYEPVSVLVTIQRVTEEDVTVTLESLALNSNTSLEEIDDSWVQEHALGAHTVDELRKRLREDRLQDARRLAEEEKANASVTELTKRLGQAIPKDEVAHYRNMIVRTNELDAGRLGLSLDDLLARLGTTRAAFEKTADEQAERIATEEAALSAFAAERKLSVDDSELAFLLGVNEDDAQELLDSAKRNGSLEELRRQCLARKAARVVAAECTCVYQEETPAEAQERNQKLQAAIAQARDQDAAHKSSPSSGPDLHLV